MPFGVAAADFDNDGDVDIATSNWGSNSICLMYNAGSAGSFSSPITYPVGSAPVDIVAVDVNQDGFLDIAVVNGGSDDISVLINCGGEGFASAVEYAVKDYPRGLCSGDFDLDGDMDLATADFDLDSINVLLNEFQGADIGFRPNPDGWQFANDWGNMWPSTWTNQFDYSQSPYDQLYLFESAHNDWFPDWPLWVDIFGEDACYLDPTDETSFRPSAVQEWLSWHSPWGGSCFGFAVSSFLFFGDYMDVPTEFPPHSELFNVQITDESRLMINRYMWYQVGENHWDHVLAVSGSTDPNAALQECKQMLAAPCQDHRVLAFFNNYGWGGHAVNPYRHEAHPTDPDIEYIYIYDNNYPDDETCRIEFNTALNSWYYSRIPHWGGPGRIGLMEPIGEYASPPVHPLKARDNDSVEPLLATSHSTAEDGNFHIYCTGIDTIRWESSLGSIGMEDDSLWNNVDGAYPLTLLTGQETPPLGYSLPAEVWTGTLRADEPDISDIVITIEDMFSPANQDIMMHDWWGGIANIQPVYDAFDKTLSLENVGAITEANSFGFIHSFPDSEIAINLTDILLDAGEALSFTACSWACGGGMSANSVNEPNAPASTMGTYESGLYIANTGIEKSYDAAVRIHNADGVAEFMHEDVTLAVNAAHLIVPDWRPFDNLLQVLVDNGMTGEYDDTLSLANESCDCGDQTGEHPNRVGDINCDGATDPLDVQFLVNFVYKGLDARCDKPLCPLETGDVNCDGGVDPLDVQYLVNFVYKGLDALCEPCPQ